MPYDQSNESLAKRSRKFAATGADKQAWAVFVRPPVANSTDPLAATTIIAMTPQGPKLSPEVVADVPGVDPFYLSDEQYKKTFHHLRPSAAGSTHDSPMFITFVVFSGGDTSMKNIARSIGRGKLHETVRLLLEDTRAVLLVKPNKFF